METFASPRIAAWSPVWLNMSSPSFPTATLLASLLCWFEHQNFDVSIRRINPVMNGIPRTDADLHPPPILVFSYWFEHCSGDNRNCPNCPINLVRVDFETVCINLTASRSMSSR